MRARIGSQRNRVPTYALHDHVYGDCEVDQLGRLVKGSGDCRNGRKVYVGCERAVVLNEVNNHRTVTGEFKSPEQRRKGGHRNDEPFFSSSIDTVRFFRWRIGLLCTARAQRHRQLLVWNAYGRCE